MNAVRLAALRFSIVFVALFILLLPLSYYVLPDVGEVVATPVESIIDWVGRSLLGLKGPFATSLLSDSTGMYINTLLVMVAAAVLSGAWHFLERRRPDSEMLRYWFHAGISYYLSLQLLRYGFDKVFKTQFYLPEPNTAFTPLGYLAPDILYWSTVGSSWSYSFFGGMLEVIPALLLLFDRTRWPGAIGAVAVMIHVVMINFAFDISVKLFSIFLLLLALIVSAPALGILARLFILDQQVTIRKWRPSLDTGRKELIYTIVKSAVVGLMLFESLYLYFSISNFNDDLAARPALHGAYDVELFIRNGDTLPPLLTERNRFRRFFIHRRGYFITQSMNDSMFDYRLDYDTQNRRLLLGRRGRGLLAYEYRGDDSVLVLHGKIDGDSLDVVARQIDLRSLPLYKGSFHWTIDAYR